ncbi:MAG: helix-turn-helix domain-containing protein [Elusimicrobia bacterium]|nr:helix-turn-helix domain-containing protein [Elusimicrobiota bacterium]
MFGKRVKELRIKKGWSQQKLAEEAKMSYSLICKLEQDIAKEPTIQTAISLADTFNISLDSLVGRKFPKK